MIPFEDQLYFSNIPANTGAVGLVFYEYVSLDGACTAGLSPYQEVASGLDNEKFSGDYGFSIPPLQSREPAIDLAKSVDQAMIGPALPATLTYTIQITNTGPITVGNPRYGVPLVIRERIPDGALYVVGTADDTITMNGGSIDTIILYSTDDGATWSESEPVGGVTDIQWWLQEGFPPGATGSVVFQVIVPATYRGAYLSNVGAIGFGNAASALEDDAVTFLLGNNSVGGAVHKDDGPGGLFANSSQDAGEDGISSVAVTLYYDLDNNGELDDADIVWGTTETDGSGNYSFTSLPDGNYIVVVDRRDPDLLTGWTNTNAIQQVVDLDAVALDSNPVNELSIDFGFAPVLTINKKVVGASTIYADHLVQYTINMTNRLPGTGTASGGSCAYTVWSASEDSRTSVLADSQHWDFPANAFGMAGPDGHYALSPLTNARDKVAGTSFGLGTPQSAITKVEALFSIYLNGTLVDDSAAAWLYFNDAQIGALTFSPAQLNVFAGSQSTQGLLTWDVTSVHPWTWSDFAGNLDLQIDAIKSGSTDGPTIYLDAMGFRVTSDELCAADSSNIVATLPLIDTYDPTQLHFLAATPTVGSSTPAGTLTWTNLGPLYPGQTKSITVTFRALEPLVSPETLLNTVVVTDAYFADGYPANSATATETVSLVATGSIAGVLWNDVDSDGWQGANGYENTDSRIPNVTVTLYGCKNSAGTLITGARATRNCSFYGGTWHVVATHVTDATGAYHFTGLYNGYYYVAVSQATIPGTDSQTGDPNDRIDLCAPSNCDNQSNGTGDNLGATTFLGQITAANDVTNVNFGYSVPPALYGNVWVDSDGDGGRESGEQGIGAVTVRLYANASCTGTPQTTSTNSNGDYTFGNLTNGTTYCLQILTTSLPSGGTWSGTAESDGVINNQITVTAQNGMISGSHDFGFHQSGLSSIGDTLYYDWNGDGTQGASDEGIPNIPVALYKDLDSNGQIDPSRDPLIAVVSTDASGAYLFTNLPAGSYLVLVDDADAQFPANVSQTGDPDESGTCATCDRQSSATVNGTNHLLTADFGYQPTGSGFLGDTVFYDQNGDGLQRGVRETGFFAVTVDLWADLNGDGSYLLVMTTTTDAAGNYRFANLPDGDYQVIVDSNDSAIPNDAFGNNYVLTTAAGYRATISSGTVIELNGVACTACDLAADFGFTALGAIGDTVYWDANNDGERDFTERGIANVLITLTNSSVITTADGTVYQPGTYIVTTTTADGTGSAPLGYYSFNGLPIGDYTITVDTSGPIGGAAQSADPDRDGETCINPTYPGLPACDNATTMTVGAGNNFMGADFGYRPSGAIGDFVWFDQDGDGIQDDGEVGIAALLVTVTNGSTTFTTTTDYNGEYNIIGLTAGNWTVTIEQPASMIPTIGADSIDAKTTTVTIDGNGNVTAIGGVACSDCALDVDLGFAMNGAYALSGSLCLEGTSATNGVCRDGTDVAVAGYTIYLYNDDGNYLGATTTDNTGVYTFTNLVADIYYVVIGTSLPPLNDATLTTTAAKTPASTIIMTSATARQVVAVDATLAVDDGGLDATMVEGIDFAYISTINYDYGDLPAPYNTSLTHAPDGPRHRVLDTPLLYLGTIAPDSEDNGVPSTYADSDGSDEDGLLPVDLMNWTVGVAGGTIEVTVNGIGWLVGWIDFNGDGDFTDSGEMIVSQAMATGTRVISFDIPIGTNTGGGSTFYSRFRLFATQPTLPQFAYSGATASGEVEDYYWSTITPTADLEIIKYDALDPMIAGTTLTYTIVITNYGPNSAENVIITDTLPLGTTYMSAPLGCLSVDDQVICAISTIGAGNTVIITIAVLVDPKLTSVPAQQQVVHYNARSIPGVAFVPMAMTVTDDLLRAPPLRPSTETFHMLPMPFS